VLDLRKNDNVGRLYALRLFLTACILPDGYHFPDSVSPLIFLTDRGERELRQLSDEHPSWAEADLKMAVFAEFGAGSEFLVDHARTEFEPLREALSPDVRCLLIRFPWAYGDELEIAYIQAFGQDPKNFIPYNGTMTVVKELPQGVFQVADVTVGPFGIVQVQESRYTPPSLCGPEIFCTDPGCDGVHHVRFSTGKTNAGEAYLEVAPDVPLSNELSTLFADLSMPDEMYYRPDNDWSLPWLLMSGFTSNERRLLLATLIERDDDSFKETCHRLLDRGSSTKSPEQLAEEITEGELLQLLLCATNERIIWNIENLIDDGKISLGLSETRFPIRSRHAQGGFFQSMAEVSRLGVRFRPADDVTFLRLKNFVQQLYPQDSRDDLSWILRNESGANELEKLDNYLLARAPEEVVANLMLVTRQRATAALRAIGPGRFDLSPGQENDKFLIQRMLWKLGMPLPPPAVVESRTLQHLSAFELNSRTEWSRSEQGVESVRSSGLSMFVAFEDLLQSVIGYIPWLLFSDHYVEKRDARFIYRPIVAKDYSNYLLGQYARKVSGFSYSANGRNALGVLGNAFALVAHMCANPAEVVDDTLRRIEEIPFAVRYSPIYSFPFMHKSLIFDLTPNSRQSVIGSLRAVTEEFRAGGIAKVRNSLSHPRQSFPEDGEVAQACASVRRVIAFLQSGGLLPTVYAHKSTNDDAIGRKRVIMCDGEGREVVLAGRSELDRCGLPAFHHPQLIPTGIQLNATSHPIRLKYIEDTPFTALQDAHLPLRFTEMEAAQEKD
jgi:hypothetical protein